MLLTDTTPLVALIVPDEPAHVRCNIFVVALQEPMLTTWPCLTETAHFLYKSGGWPRVAILWQLVTAGKIFVHHPDANEMRRVAEIMRQYHDLPCDIADASLIAAAETLNLRRIFTLEGHFYAYRLADKSAFEVLP